LGSPVVFVQQRPGVNGQIFRLYKFRTMLPETYPGQPDDARLTRFGRFLRTTSLDELPSLWNILKGDMSLVGPRPLLVSYLEIYDEHQKRRHAVRPGLTGLAQVSGRNNLDWSERLELDVWYVDNCSLPLDLRVILKTVLVTLKREGITP